MNCAWGTIDSKTLRRRLVDKIFAWPHQNTVEDVEWCAEEWGMDEEGCKQVFVDAVFCVCVFNGNSQPIYMVAVKEDGIVCTCATPLLDEFKISVTKCLKQMIRTQEARIAFAGSMAGVDWADWSTGRVRGNWAIFLGFIPEKIRYTWRKPFSWFCGTKIILPYPTKIWRRLLLKPDILVLRFNGTGER